MKRFAWIKSLLLLLLSITSFRSAVADWNDVPTGSMKPSILEGDRVFVNKVAYDLKVPFTTVRLATWDHPERGDIVVFFSPVDGKRLIKRVVGVSGDHLAWEDKRLVINGEPVLYEDGREVLGDHVHPVLFKPGARDRDFELEVPEGHVFVMGDNRDDSLDSRWFGFVPETVIVGRAEAVALSVDPENGYRPRWSRFFTSLP